jgi:hypothetical protein
MKSPFSNCLRKIDNTTLNIVKHCFNTIFFSADKKKKKREKGTMFIKKFF